VEINHHDNAGSTATLNPPWLSNRHTVRKSLVSVECQGHAWLDRDPQPNAVPCPSGIPGAFHRGELQRTSLFLAGCSPAVPGRCEKIAPDAESGQTSRNFLDSGLFRFAQKIWRSQMVWVGDYDGLDSMPDLVARLSRCCYAAW